MAIPGIVQNLIAQTGNQQILVSWDLSTGAVYYKIQRSLDNVTFTDLTILTGSPLAISYIDSAVTIGTQYFYQVAASIDGSTYSSYAPAVSAIPAPAGETTLAAIRLQAQQRADRVGNNFVSTSEWNNYINTSMYELYDLLITVYEDYYLARPVSFVTDGSTFLYPIPNGSNTFNDGITQSGPVTPPALYKLQGVDLALQTANNAFATINKFNFIDRNKFLYPNTASTIYGVFNLQYRMMGSNIEFIPTPTAGQNIRLWYIPRLTTLLQDTDTTSISISGWIEYVIVKAAYYALTKEESDTSSLVQQLVALNDRIISSASNRDVGQPDTISDTRSGNGWGNNGNGGFNGGTAGF